MRRARFYSIKCIYIASALLIGSTARAGVCVEGRVRLKDGSDLVTACAQDDGAGRRTRAKLTVNGVSRVVDARADLALGAEGGAIQAPPRSVNGSLATIAAASRLFVVESAGPDEAVPVQIHPIDCTGARCAWAAPRCGYDEPFRLPDWALVQSAQVKGVEREIIESFLAKLAAPEAGAPDPRQICSPRHLGYFKAHALDMVVRILTQRVLTGDHFAARCLDTIAATQNTFVERPRPEAWAEVTRWRPVVDATCRPKDLPPVLTPLEASDVAALPVDLGAVVGVVVDAATGMDVVPLFRKLRGAWSSVSGQKPLFSSSPTFRVPTPVVGKQYAADLWMVTQPAPRLPPALTWNLVFDGKSFAPLETRGYEAEAALAKAVPTAVAARIRDLKAKGFFVLASTAPKITDPDGWHRARPTRSEVTRAKAAFIARHETKKNCVDGEDVATLVDTKKLLGAADLRVHDASYRDRSGRALLGVGVGLHCVTDPESLEPYGLTHWYVVAPGLDARRVATDDAGELRPVDAADFDGDERSEWVFRADDHHGPSLVLFDRDFSVLASTASTAMRDDDLAYQFRRQEYFAGPFAPPPATAPAGARIESVSSAEVDVNAVTGEAPPHRLRLKNNVDYLIRVRTARTSREPGRLEDSFVMIFDPGRDQPTVINRGSALRGEPAAFVRIDADGDVLVTVGSVRPGRGGRARVDVFRVGALSEPLFDLAAPPVVDVPATPGGPTVARDGIVTVARLGDLVDATYALKVTTPGGPARSLPVHFDADQSQRGVAVLVPVGAVITAELAGPSPTTAANMRVLGLRTKVSMRGSASPADDARAFGR